MAGGTRQQIDIGGGLVRRIHRMGRFGLPPGRAFAPLSAAVLCVLCSLAKGAIPNQVRLRSTVRAVVSIGRPGRQISPNFSGLSFEMKTILANRYGRHFFSPKSKDIVTLFHTLGIGSLRVGGNTADLADIPMPTRADIRSLFAFARVAHVRVIYTLRLRGAEHPARAARIAAFMTNHFSAQLTGFALGNEPNLYDRRFAKYKHIWRLYEAAILHRSPTARFCGPGSTGSGAWAMDFLASFGHDPHLKMLTQHTYVGGSAWKVKSPRAGRSFLLSARIDKQYSRFNRDFGRLALARNLPFRLEETNSFYNGGAKNVSDTFAACLWGLDYMWWWAAHGARGLNFHTGNWVAAGPRLTRCRYAIFWTTSHGLEVHPLGYAMAAFNLAGRGRYVPIKIKSSTSAINMTAYGSLQADGSLYATFINRMHGSGAATVRMSLPGGRALTQVWQMTLRAPDDSASAKRGIKLGNGSIQPDGTWRGRWMKVPRPGAGQAWKITIKPMSALVLKLVPAVPLRQ